MARYTPSSASTIPEVNQEFEKIEVAVKDTLSRKGDAPNAMESSLDMNSNRIINLPDPLSDSEAVNKRYVDDAALNGISVDSESWPYETKGPSFYGAVGDGVTDDTTAMQLWANQGGYLPLPRGVYRITQTINLKSNCFVVGESQGKGTGSGVGGLSAEATAGASIIYVDSAFNTSGGNYALNFEQPSAQFSGGGENFSVWNDRTGGASCGLVRVKGAYDGLSFRNMNLIFAGGGKEALLVEFAATANNVGQTVLLENIVCIGSDDSVTSTEPVVRLKRINEFQMVGVKVFGSAIFLDPLRTGNCIELDSCRGGTLLGCSAAATEGSGIYIRTSIAPSFGINITGTTYEQCNTASLMVDGDADPTRDIAYIQEYAPRYEPTQNKGPMFVRALNCRSETTFWSSTIDANSDNCVIYATNKDVVTNNGGTSNAVVGMPSTFSASWGYSNDIAVSKATNSTVYLYNGTVNGYRLRSLTSEADNFGFEIADRSDTANVNMLFKAGDLTLKGVSPGSITIMDETVTAKQIGIYNNCINLDAGSGTGQGVGAGVMTVPISANHNLTGFHTNKEMVYSGGGATVTLPTNATTPQNVGAKFSLLNTSFTVTVNAAAGVTINGVSGGSFTLPQYEACILTKVGTDAWIVVGGMSDVA